MKPKAQGVSLLELLIASALGSLIISGLIQVYLAIKINNNKQTALLNLQDSERFAQYILNQRIRLAGLVACQNSQNPVDQNQAISGYNSDHLPPFLQGQVIAGTDAILIKSCVSHSHFTEEAQLTTMAYYIGDTHRKNREGKAILGLFQKPQEGERLELIPGVEQMQILYGVRKENTSELLTYFSADQVIDWASVHGVQVDLLFNSIEPILSKPQAYIFQGRTMMPLDLLLYKSINTYIKLRER